MVRDSKELPTCRHSTSFREWLESIETLLLTANSTRMSPSTFPSYWLLLFLWSRQYYIFPYQKCHLAERLFLNVVKADLFNGLLKWYLLNQLFMFRRDTLLLYLHFYKRWDIVFVFSNRMPLRHSNQILLGLIWSSQVFYWIYSSRYWLSWNCQSSVFRHHFVKSSQVFSENQCASAIAWFIWRLPCLIIF